MKQWLGSGTNPRSHRQIGLLSFCVLAVIGLSYSIWLLRANAVSFAPDFSTAILSKSDSHSSLTGVFENSTTERAEVAGGIASIPEPAAPGRLSGSIRFLDAEGEHVPSARGYIRWLVSPTSTEAEEVISGIVHDRWQLDAPPDARIRLLQALWSSETETQNADVEPLDLECRDLQGAELTAVLRSGPLLNVVDSMTRGQLSDVQIVHASPSSADLSDLRIPALELLQGRPKRFDSPMQLGDRPGTRIGWVRAGGYAWARFGYRGAGGEVTVALAQGSTLEVRLVNRQDPTARWFVLGFALDASGEASREPVFEREVTNQDRLRVEGLPAERLRIALTASPRIRGAGPYAGICDLEFHSGVTESVQFDLSVPGLSRGLAALDVMLPAVDSHVASSNPRLILEPRDIAGDVAAEWLLAGRWKDRSRPHTATFLDILPGHYQVTLMPDGVTAPVDLIAGRKSALTLARGNLATVEVVVRRTGIVEKFTSADLRYRPSSAKSFRAWNEVGPDIDAGTYTFRCTPGVVSLLCGYDGRKWVEREYSIVPGTQRLEVELEPESKRTITVRAVQGETEVSLPYAYWSGASVRSLDVPGGVSCGSTIGSSQVGNLSAMDAPCADYYVDRAGRYELTFPYWSGLAPVEPLRVDVSDTGPAVALVTVDFN